MRGLDELRAGPTRLAKRRSWILRTAILLIGLPIFLLITREELAVTHYALESDKLTVPVRLAVLTDLHGTWYGDGQQDLLGAIAAEEPDVVLLVGDIIDKTGRLEAVEALLEAIGSEYPCYYVSGNHEYYTGLADVYKTMIASYGVTVLQGGAQVIVACGQSIRVGGVDDPHAFDEEGHITGMWLGQLAAAGAETGDGIYSLLLSHRPDFTGEYEQSGFDLVLCGHAHGGQVRNPLLRRGLYAPNQGLFPQYTEGVHQLGNVHMLVSRGLCRNWFFRVLNPPELVIVDVLPK